MEVIQRTPIPRKKIQSLNDPNAAIGSKTKKENNRSRSHSPPSPSSVNSNKKDLLDLSQCHITEEIIKKEIIYPVMKYSEADKNIQIRELAYYQQAFVHKSILQQVRLNEKLGNHVCEYMKESNERLEYMGDAVINLIIGEYLYKAFPNHAEGELTKFRSRVVCGKTLAHFARCINLQGKILMSDQTKRMNGHQNEHLLENTFEAFIGAIFLDQSFEVAKVFMMNVLNEFFDKLQFLKEDNYKDILLRLVHNHKLSIPQYQIIAERGPVNDKEFDVVVLINGKQMGRGTDRRKKLAEQNAAQDAISRIKSVL